MENENIVEALNFLKDRIDEVNTKVDQLNDVIFKQVLEPAQESLLKADYEDFSNRYGEQLNPVLEQYKALYPYEEDPMMQVYTESKNVDNEDEFVSQVAQALKSEIDSIKSTLGLSNEAEVKDVDIEKGEATIEDPATDTEVTVESDVASDAAEAINSPEEIAAFEKKLEAYL